MKCPGEKQSFQYCKTLCVILWPTLVFFARQFWQAAATWARFAGLEDGCGGSRLLLLLLGIKCRPEPDPNVFIEIAYKLSVTLEDGA